MLKQYQREAFRNFQSKALELTPERVEFRESILRNALKEDGEKFISWLEDEMRQMSSGANIITDDEEPVLPDSPEKYTEGQFIELPSNTAEKIWDTWKDINPGVLCCSTVWGYIVSRFIKSGKVSPHCLMHGGNGGQATGKSKIEKALAAEGDERIKSVDKCIRAFLRRFSGLQIVRGTRSVYQDCPPAKAWWQYYIANETSNNTDAEVGDIINLFKKPGFWESLSDKMASQLTVIGDKNIRDGVILYFLEENKKRKKEDIVKIFDAIGVMCAWRALGFFPPDEIKEIIKKEIVKEGQV